MWETDGRLSTKVTKRWKIFAMSHLSVIENVGATILIVAALAAAAASPDNSGGRPLQVVVGSAGQVCSSLV